MAAGLQPGTRSKPFISTKVPLPSERIRRVPIMVRAPAPVQPAQPKRRAPEPHEYPAYDAPTNKAFAASPLISPDELWKVLEVAPYVHIQFETEKQLTRFRINLWKVNAQGRFRYSTRREGWTGLVVLRLK